MRAVSSVVERLPYKQVVIGSNPIPPTIIKLYWAFFMMIELDNSIVIYFDSARFKWYISGSSSKGLGQGPSKSLM